MCTAIWRQMEVAGLLYIKEKMGPVLLHIIMETMHPLASRLLLTLSFLYP